MSPEIPRGPVVPPGGPRAPDMRPRGYTDPSKQDTHLGHERAYGNPIRLAGNIAFLILIVAFLAGAGFVVYNLIAT